MKNTIFSILYRVLRKYQNKAICAAILVLYISCQPLTAQRNARNIIYISTDMLRSAHVKEISETFNEVDTSASFFKEHIASWGLDFPLGKEGIGMYKWLIEDGRIDREIPYLKNHTEEGNDTLDMMDNFIISYGYENGKLTSIACKEGAAIMIWGCSYKYSGDKMVRAEYDREQWMTGCCDYENPQNPNDTSFTKTYVTKDSFVYNTEGMLQMCLESHCPTTSEVSTWDHKYEDSDEACELNDLKNYSDTLIYVYQDKLLIGCCSADESRKSSRKQLKKSILKFYQPVSDINVTVDGQPLTAFVRKFSRNEPRYVIIQLNEDTYLYFKITGK